MGINVRQKGQRAEREVIKLLQPVVDKVYGSLGLEPPLLERNQQQTNKGGYDIIGLDWMALEIKHQEKADLPSMVEKWWQQTLRQTKRGQESVLMYRRNGVAWRVRLFDSIGSNHYFCPVEISMDDFLSHFEIELRCRLGGVK